MLECDQAHEHCWVMTSEMLSLTTGRPFQLKQSIARGFARSGQQHFPSNDGFGHEMIFCEKNECLRLIKHMNIAG
jgi:hypothetical protein